MVAFMWALETIDYIAPGTPLDHYGIHPRDPAGLLEILSAPFLHVGFGHLISNTVPFAIMGAAIALGGLARVALVTLIVAVVSGFGVWLIAPSNEVHLGASGLVFGYAGADLLAGAPVRRDRRRRRGVLPRRQARAGAASRHRGVTPAEQRQRDALGRRPTTNTLPAVRRPAAPRGFVFATVAVIEIRG
jgi:hypothetical protein